jgi:hypothetical protein
VIRPMRCDRNNAKPQLQVEGMHHADRHIAIKQKNTFRKCDKEQSLYDVSERVGGSYTDDPRHIALSTKPNSFNHRN